MQLDRSCGLIVVDMQEDFMDGGPLGMAGARDLIGSLNRVIEHFATKAGAVCYTRDWHPENHCSFKKNGGPWPVHCVKNTKGASFSKGLRVLEEGVVISKATRSHEEAYSGFRGTELADILRDRGISKVFVTGVATEYCVFETVMDALSLGFVTFVLTDCVLGVDEQSCSKALARMKQKGAGLIKAADLY